MDGDTQETVWKRTRRPRKAGSNLPWQLVRGAMTFLALLLLLGFGWLLLVAERGSTRMLWLSCMCTIILLLALVPWLFGRRFGMAIMIGVGGLSLLLFGGAIWLAPGGIDPAPTGFSSLQEGEHAARWGITNLVPEVDQLVLGSYLFGLVDTRLGSEKAAALRADIVDLYAEMADDPRFGEARSALGVAYADMAGEMGKQHAYLYLPENAVQPAPVLLFMHGSIGNFQAYTWILKEVADQTGYAVYAPSYGYGLWHSEEGQARLEQAMEEVAADARLDEGRLVLMALSQGGYGVYRHAMTAPDPDAYAGFVLLSPVFLEYMANSMGEALGADPPPVLILHGKQDGRIAAEDIEAAVEAFQVHHVPVEFHLYDDGDHFIFFSHRADVVAQLTAWLKGL